MASKKSAIADVKPAEMTPEETYNAHNDVTARDWPKEKQCQCEVCQGLLK